MPYIPDLILAAGEAPPFFIQTAWLLMSAAVIGFVCFRFGIVPIVGFLLAGVVIGPNGLGLVTDRELVDASAEVGVILLLFTIGIEFSLDKLARIKRLIFGGGGLQVFFATGATMALLMAFGVSWQAAMYTGFLVALSSTAIVLSLLRDGDAMNTPKGQVGLGLLIFQDLAIILMVLFVPMLGGASSTPLEIAIVLGKALGIILLVLVVARRVMPKVLDAVARTCSQEIFLLTVIAICFGTGYLTSLADVSLSLGAFLAGLIVSESKFSEHAMGEILPLQIIFSAAFFVSVGMLLDVMFIMTNPLLIVGVIIAVLLIKLLTTGLSLKIMGYGWPVTAGSAFMLAQVGEFSFVLERAGRQVGLYPAGMEEVGAQAFIATTVVLMIATPTLMKLGGRATSWLGQRELQQEVDEMMAEETGHAEFDPAGIKDHVIVAGYGTTARRLVRAFEENAIPYVITTLSPQGADEAEAEGRPVLRGDSTRQSFLEHAGLDRARMLVISDDTPAMAHRIAIVARSVRPEMPIAVRTRYADETDELEHAGVDYVVSGELESTLTLCGKVLSTFDFDDVYVRNHIDE
ncbi:MAG: cation:proton antiporter, partial [Bacteroidota bacterium]